MKARLSERTIIMNGKNRCRILKDIRKRIADANGIEYAISECKFKGDCLGTCPKCESEVRYLERELEKKRSLGQKIAVAGIAASITLAATGCTSDFKTRIRGNSLTGDVPMEESVHGEGERSEASEGSVSEIVDGEIVEVIGEVPDTSYDESDVFTELLGDIEPPDTMGEEPDNLMPEPDEIVNPYLDDMGQVPEFCVDLNEIALMTQDEALDAMREWTREYIDYHWSDAILLRDYRRTEFTTTNNRLVEIWYDGDGRVDSIFVYEQEIETVGDLPIEDYE